MFTLPEMRMGEGEEERKRRSFFGLLSSKVRDDGLECFYVYYMCTLMEILTDH